MKTNSYEVEELGLPGVLLIKPKVFPDARGFSVVPYSEEDFVQLGITARFVQDYTSHSVKNVIRGLHFQRAPHMQGKLVRCSSGEIMDVVADYNPAAPTYGMYVTATLRAEDQATLFIPGRYAHGFCVLSDEAVTEYKMSDMHIPEFAGGIRWNDPFFGILWPVTNPILSEQDKAWPLLSPIAQKR